MITARLTERLCRGRAEGGRSMRILLGIDGAWAQEGR